MNKKLVWIGCIIFGLIVLGALTNNESNDGENSTKKISNVVIQTCNYEIVSEMDGVFITDGPVLHLTYSIQNNSDYAINEMELHLYCYDERGKNLGSSIGGSSCDFYPFGKSISVQPHTIKNGSMTFSKNNLGFNPRLIDNIKVMYFQ